MIPKIFVGTLHSGEGDYIKCIEAIHEQTAVDVTHVTISNLSEKQAHNELWQKWRENKAAHDLFVKIDADTVLSHKSVLSRIYECFARDQNITGLQAPLHDYMTNDLINGLNCFSTDVVFLDTYDDLFCDRQVDINHKKIMRQNELPQELCPAGFHCYHATEIQAFHYGFHRSLKNQVVQMSKVLHEWKLNHDKIRGLALIGAAKALNLTSHNYTDIEFQRCFTETIENYDKNLKILGLT